MPSSIRAQFLAAEVATSLIAPALLLATALAYRLTRSPSALDAQLWWVALGLSLWFPAHRYGALALASLRHASRVRVANAARQEALAHLGQMITVVAHELKNPLAGISGAVAVVRDRLPIGEERQVMVMILQRLAALDTLAEELLLFASPRPPLLIPLAIRPFLEETAQLLRNDPKAQHVVVEITGEAPATIPGDPRQLRGAFLNLLLNAAQAMQGSGTIRVRTSISPERCTIGVSDSGGGIRSEDRARIFEPFFTTKQTGTGLGLVIAQQVVEAHGGKLSVECPPSGGTTMRVELPVAFSPSAPEAPRAPG